MSAPLTPASPPRDVDGRLPSEAIVTPARLSLVDEFLQADAAAEALRLIYAAARLADLGYRPVPIVLTRAPGEDRVRKIAPRRWNRLRDPFAELHAFADRVMDVSQPTVNAAAIILDGTGLVVADKDDPDLPAFLDRIAPLGAPGVVERTRRGYHAFWRIPAGFAASSIHGAYVGDGVQIRARELLVTAVCTRKDDPNYRPYNGSSCIDEVDPADIPVADPDALRALLACRQPAPTSQRRAGRRLASPAARLGVEATIPPTAKVAIRQRRRKTSRLRAPHTSPGAPISSPRATATFFCFTSHSRPDRRPPLL